MYSPEGLSPALMRRLAAVRVRVATWRGAPIIETTLADIVLHWDAFDTDAHFEIVEGGAC